MEIPIGQDRFVGRGLAVRTAGLFTGPRLIIDGAEAKGRRRRYVVRDNSGREVTIRLRTSYVDPIPKVEVDAQVLELARRLRWHEYAWMGLPILLSLGGGALGALVGMSAVYSSARIFRSERSDVSKYGLTALISVAAVFVFLVLALSIEAALKR